MSVFLANEQADYRVDEPSLARLARLVMDAEVGQEHTHSRPPQVSWSASGCGGSGPIYALASS